MNRPGVAVELAHAATLCYAMQQCAVRWLHGVRVRNDSPGALRDVELTVRVTGGFAPPWTTRLAEVPAGGAVDLPPPDLPLSAAAFANAIERQRVELEVVLDGAGERLATAASPLDVLAYNEWPGLGELPGLLAAFVAPNHPALAPLLQDVAARLHASTGRAALDGYQSGDPERARAIVAAGYDAVQALGIAYVQAPPSFERRGQKVRTPEQIVAERLGTCLDLALLHAALLEHAGLRPFVVFEPEHAFAGAWLVPASSPTVVFGPAVELRKRLELGALAVVECTLGCAGNGAGFAAAAAAAQRRLARDDLAVHAIDVAAARREGIRPLPVRTHAFAPAAEGEPLAVSTPLAPQPGNGDAVAVARAATDEAPPPPPAPPPQDRLEHWKQKLLDLSMWNRLLNFAPTKKSVQLCAHEPAALERRLQSGGRVRVFARPSVGAPGQDPRDVTLLSARAGVDVPAEYLAEELRAGRLRAEHDAEDLDARLVEIFRHARTSLEESGANTLYLAIGFLRYYETPTSQKQRRAPLLLLPLVVERLSVQDGFRFVLDDAEPRLNRTLLQFLQHDFDLRVPLGDTPPENDDGVDVEAVFAAFRTAALAIPRWEVDTSACIAFFSFTKYLMWLDLANRDALLRSPVLRHLVERPGTGYVQAPPEIAREELDTIDPATLFCPKDADSSQLAAVVAAANGRSFVLEGPPGTGKSQTITNLIAQALANGKRVLFVAEKRAALEVVQGRLAAVGLGPFCLELHSSKSGPRAVLEQLRQALDAAQRREPAEWTKVAAELQDARSKLNTIVAALHRPREHGSSVFAAMAELVALREIALVPLPDLDGGAPERVAAAQAAITALAGVTESLGVPRDHAWWGVRRTEFTPSLARAVLPAAERLARAAAALAIAVSPVAQALGLERAFAPAGPSRDQLAALIELARWLKGPDLPPPAVLRADWRTLEPELAAAIETGRRRDAAWSPLSARWRRELLALDLDRIAAAWAAGASSFVLLRWWRLRPLRAELAPAATGRVGAPAAVAADLAAALRVRADERALGQLGAAAAALGAHWRAGLADWTRVAAWLDQVRAVRRALVRAVPGSLAPEPGCLDAIARQLEGLADGAAALPPALGALEAAHDELVAALAAVVELLALDLDEAFAPAAAPGHLAHVQARVERWRAAPASLRDVCHYRAAADAAVPLGVRPLVDAHARGELAAAALLPAFRKSFVQAWLDGVHRAEPELASFRGLDHERAIARFAELDRRQIRLAAEVVRARLAADVPRLRDTTVASSELGILEREIKKKGRHRPVRRLFGEIPGLLGKLAPCMLMSPLSVAQFLTRGGFDLVVFDEASQIPMWDAVGAIGRGESLVVVGDSRQLPPTTFFQRQAQGDEIADDEIPEDLESVLDECGAAGLPRQHLDWHYRSRHESLIAFSNHHYYKNRLLTFPSPRAVAPGLGVRLVRVDGVYDRSKSQQNPREAEVLVAEVQARLLDPQRGGHSLGIVTFSQKQQVLIEDLLDRARRENPALEAAFGAQAEPVFVKNLENVQGDERDVILFSICYGPDAQGRVHENYGPLNRQHGERRLNVAVTRARRELVVFASLGPEQVATRSQAVGAAHLRTFLDYAMRGAPALAAAAAVDPSRGTDSPFEDAVRDALERRGHVVHTQIGCSDYRIDLAVVDPRAPGRYLLGIECDGASYHGAATARDRDRLRAAVLQDLGWRLHRVWSTDFWQFPDAEIERIEAALAHAAAAPEPTIPAPAIPAPPVGAPGSPPAPPVGTEPGADAPHADAAPTPFAPFAPSAPSAPPAPSPAASGAAPASAAAPERAAARAVDHADPDGPRPFAAASLPAAGTPEAFQAAAALRPLRAAVADVLAHEGPVRFDRLARTVAQAWDLTRLTDRVRDRVRLAFPTAAVRDGDVVWADAAQRDAFRGFRVPEDGAPAPRGPEELPEPELVNAMAWLLGQHQALTAEDLARETARCFGIARLGTIVRDVMNGAIERLVAAGRAVRDGDVVRAS